MPPAPLEGQQPHFKLGKRCHPRPWPFSPGHYRRPAMAGGASERLPADLRCRRRRSSGRQSRHVRSQSVTSYSCLTFLTDFGLEDGFVAACHGVALRIAPSVPMIDITHLVPPGDVRRGAAVLAQTVPAMPPAVHVAVVDPGVGTTRRAIAVEAKGGVLVGPDNGLLSWAITALGGATRAVLLTNEALWNHPVAPTFHGRDIFMPVASHL